MARLVQFVFPNETEGDDLSNLGRLMDDCGSPYFSSEQPERLIPDEPPIEDEDDPELVETLSALYWFRRQEPLEDE